MAINYYQFFNPMYYFVDNTGQPLTGGFVFWYESDDHSTFKPVYKVPPTQSDPAGTPWPNPLPLNSAGFQGDNYGIWGADDKPYYVEVRVSSDPTSELILSEDNFSPPITNGGGGSNTGSADNNVLVNGQFTYYTKNYDVIDASIPESIPNLAPGDWFFAKSNGTASDTLVFDHFVPGQTDVPQNPVNFLHYSCTAPGSGETFKQIGVIFRATPELPGSGVNTFAGQTVTLQFVAQSTISSVIAVNIHQNFGTGGSAQVDTAIDTITLTTTWPTVNGANPYIVTFEVPSISGKTIGTAGDFFSVTIDFPKNLSSDVQITNLKLEQASTASGFVADTVQQLQYKSVGLQFPALTNTPNLADGNYDVVLNTNGFQYISRAGRIVDWGLNTAPGDGLLCDGKPYYSYQYYNLSQLNFMSTWGIGPQAFSTSLATATITATCTINGTVSSGNSGTSGFVFTQTNNGSSTTKGVATIAVTAASSISPGDFFLINSTVANYYVWYSLNNLTIDPGPFNPVLAGKFGIKVIYTGPETNVQLATLTATQLNIAHFKVPDFRGLFKRMPSHGIMVSVPAVQTILLTCAGNDTTVTFAFVGLDQFGNPITENLTGVNATTVSTVNQYSALVSVTPNNNTASTVSLGITGSATIFVNAAQGMAATALDMTQSIYARDPDYLTRYALTTGGPTGDNTASMQQSQNLAHSHPEATGNSGGGSPDCVNALPGNNGSNNASFNRTLDSGGNQSNPNNLGVNSIILF